MTPLVLLLLTAVAAAPLTLVAGAIRPRFSGIAAVVLAGAIFALTLWAWATGGGSLDLPWAVSWGLRLHFAYDGLGALYSILAAGVGVLVLIYSTHYMPKHLHHAERPEQEQVPFFGLMMLFLGAMIALASAQDLILQFLFWDLTALASYFLIGYDREQAQAREAALMALVVTASTSVCLLIGALLLQQIYGSFSIPLILAQAEPATGPATTIAVGLIMLAALAKAAQVPLHFWLPRAMAAPTPVSAYLHSAAMVAAGVLLIGRVYPLVVHSPPVQDGLLLIGFLSMAIGGILALVQDDIKRILAYSTIAQYGYVTVLYGLGGHYGAAGAAFYVIAHGLAKSALFLSAGAVSEAGGARKLSQLGGLAGRLPLLAGASGVAAAALAGLPLTIGFFKDELFFEAALERGLPFAVACVIGAAITLAYVWRFWSGIFLGAAQRDTKPLAPLLLAPIIVLALSSVLFGIWPGPPARLSEAAGQVILAEATPLELAYHLDLRPVNLMALATYGLGILIILARPVWVGAAQHIDQVGRRFGPEQAYLATQSGLVHLAGLISRRERRDLAADVAAVLLPAAVLVGVATVAFPDTLSYRMGEVRSNEWILMIGLMLTILASVVVVRARHHLTLVLGLSAIGYVLAAVYALLAAPDVALVAVLVGTLTTLLFLGLLALFPQALLQREARLPTASTRRWRDPLVSGATGIMIFFVSWGALSQPAPSEGGSALEQARLTPLAHGKDIVTVILADFRGLDTLGEISVIAVALLGVAAMIRHWRGSQPDTKDGPS